MAGIVTRKLVDAVWPPTSVAVTEFPEAPLGTRNVQLNAPVAPVVNEPLVQLEMVLPPRTSEARPVDTEKPVPETVTVAPTGPRAGDTAIDGVVTVNDPKAVWPPTSVAVTVEPTVPLGTAKVHENAPDGSVDNEPLAQLATATPSNRRPTVLDTEKPVPATVTVAPIGPCPGVTEIAGVVTVNDPVADWPPTSVAVTVLPAVPLGTAKVQLNAPLPSVESEPLVQLEIATPSKVSDASVDETEKPVPETVTVAPTGPCPGVTTMAGVVTVNVVEAV